MTEKGDIVLVSGYGEEPYVVTGFTHFPDGQTEVRVAAYHKSNFLFGGRIHTEGLVEESRLISPLPGFEDILATGEDVAPILRQLERE